MDTKKTRIITVKTEVSLSAEKAWTIWVQPQHIVHWNFASDDWKCPSATVDLRAGGRFNCRMEAKDGSMGFDFAGTYQEVKKSELLSSKLDDGRLVEVRFSQIDDKCLITESFEAENTHSVEMQKSGWQAILDNYARYAEGLSPEG